jgi:hypothetical protein
MTRSAARNLRRALAGPVGLRDGPGRTGGELALPLPDGRELIFDYEAVDDHQTSRWGYCPGNSTRRASFVTVMLFAAEAQP